MYDDIPYDHLTIPIGGTFTADWYVDAAEGGPADWTDWSGRMEVRDSDEALLATLSSAPGADGDVIFGDVGNLIATLPSSFTSGLAATAVAKFDVKLTDPDGADHRIVEGRVRITTEVTSG